MTTTQKVIKIVTLIPQMHISQLWLL